MKCPFCQKDNDKVTDSRPVEDGEAIRRRRECLACHKRFTTYEKIEKRNIFVIKKDGTRELFDPNKIMDSLAKASVKRPISSEDLESVVHVVENKARNTLSNEVSSRDIGEWVMEELKKLDEVAYVRFASVYRQFKDVGQFIDESESLLNKDKDKADNKDE